MWPLISLPSLPVKSHLEHFTLGRMVASGPFLEFSLVFGLSGQLGKRGGMMPLSSKRLTGFLSTYIAGCMGVTG